MKTTNLEQTFIKENLIKNLIVIVLTFVFYPYIKTGLADVTAASTGDFLLIISILLVTVCFANFAFTYETVKIKDFGKRILAHIDTFIFMLLIALTLESMIIAVSKTYPSLTVIVTVFSILLYIGIALYDFWDINRAIDK